jgi:hypothetical protein
MSDDKIASTLGLRPLAEIKREEDLPVVSNTQNQLPVVSSADPDVEENLRDIELAKSNIQNIIELGDDAVKEMVSIAKQSESPRAFEVVSTLMKTLLDANRDFVEVSAKKRYAKEEASGGKKETNVTNNNLIISTADLLKMIKDGNA